MKLRGYEFRVESASLASDEHIRRNEDACFVSEDGYLGVFDGVGSEVGSEEASRFVATYCLDALRHLTRMRSREAGARDMSNVLHSAHEALIRKCLEEHDGDISTTAIIASVLIDPETDKPYAQFAHAGDSRGYIIRGNTISAATLDHGAAGPDRILQDLLSSSHYTNELPTDFRSYISRRNLITNALSSGADEVAMYVDSNSRTLMRSDIILLTSDGVHDNLTDSEILELMRDGTVQNLVESARTTSRRVNDEPYVVNGKTTYRHNFRPKFDDMTAVALYMPE